MERVVSDLFRTFDRFARAAGDCSSETWGVIAVCLLVLGYFVMKGSPVRGG
ncbi:MAG: hypothetical protein R3C03_04515 [Pirellulaceae bacterium]